MARALINQPKIILADEPIGNLDAANEAIVLDISRRLHPQSHTLIVVTHDARVDWCARTRARRARCIQQAPSPLNRRPDGVGIDAAVKGGVS